MFTQSSFRQSVAVGWVVGTILLAGFAPPNLLQAQITNIADIQLSPNAFLDQVVTVQGQVYIPANYIASRFSGYIQDGSGRGINLFGPGANDAALFDVVNIVQVTGTVALFFSTVEIVNITNVELMSSGNPPLQPMVLSTANAANMAWEGTFIQSTGTVTSIATTGGSAPATNYSINDGSGPLIIRVVDDIGAPSFSVGQIIAGRGAGNAFQSDFQILVGRTADVFDVPPPPQDCNGNISLHSQAEVNVFSCTEVVGSLTITGRTITNLNGLGSLTSVGGDLGIISNSSLGSLDGLSNLASVGGWLSVNNNYSLADINGLSNLTSLGGGLIINDNDALTNIDALSNLTSVGGDQSRSFKDLTVTFNGSLNDVDGLSNVTFVGGGLNVRFNPALARCCGLFSLLDGDGVDGSVSISTNGAGCTEQDILSSGPCFLVNATMSIEELIVEVEVLLSEPESNGLVAKLNEAIKALKKGHVTPATNKLRDFISQVNARVNSGILSMSEGQQLIDQAQVIRDSLMAPAKSSGPVRAIVEEGTWSSIKQLYR